MTNATTELSASGWTGGLVAVLLLDGTRHQALTDTVVSASVPYGQREPVAEVVADTERLAAAAVTEPLPSEARLRAAMALDLLTGGRQPISFTDVVGGDWNSSTIERLLRVLWAYLVVSCRL